MAFGAHTRSRLLLAETGDDLVVEHDGAVHQAAQRQPGLFGRAHQLLGDSGCGDIAEHDHDLGTLPEFVDHRLRFVGRRGPPVEDDAPGTAVDQPTGHGQAEPARDHR